MGDAFRALFAVIISLANVVIKLAKGTEGFAGAIENFGDLADKKSASYKELVLLDDYAEKASRIAAINAKRESLGMEKISDEGLKTLSDEANKAMAKLGLVKS